MDGAINGAGVRILADGPQVFTVDLDAVVPEPAGPLVPKGGRAVTSTVTESRTEYDTATGDLARAGVALSRTAVAGQDGRWTVRIGADSSEFPAAGRGVPVEIRELLLGARLGAALRPARRVESTRTVYVVCDRDDAEHGNLVDVRESTTALDGARETATIVLTRHVEVSGWAGPFLDAARTHLSAAGAVERQAPTETGDGTLGGMVRTTLRTQYAAILRGDLGLRSGEDLVHPTRVAIRRLRSVLRIVPATDRDRTAVLDVELSWLSGLLGAVRDVQVLRGHLHASLAAVDLADVVRLATAARVDAALDEAYAAARAALDAGLRGRRYVTLLRTLREWADEPPLSSEADEPERRVADHVRAAERSLRNRLAKAGTSEARLHRARKAAKRARYVAELPGVKGKLATRVIERAKELQTRLGDHQDCLLAADFLARTAATSDGVAAFGCGVLWTHEQRRAARAIRRATR